MSDFIQVEQLSRRFDLSEPWLVRMIYRKPRRFLDAVDNVSFAIARGKRKYDKRETIKERDWKRDKARLMRGRA